MTTDVVTCQSRDSIEQSECGEQALGIATLRGESFDCELFVCLECGAALERQGYTLAWVDE
jgi:hypothetical protein